jgi:hypothetical protein
VLIFGYLFLRFIFLNAGMDNGLLDPTRASSGIQSSAAPTGGSGYFFSRCPLQHVTNHHIFQ